MKKSGNTLRAQYQVESSDVQRYTEQLEGDKY